MTLELLTALAAFAFVGSITPGPNTLLLMASGVNHGFRATVPHIAGITVGVLVMLMAVGLGLGQVFATVPALHTALKIASIAYLLWLAWRIARSTPVNPGQGESAAGPMTFMQAAAFQWVNPKAWALCVTMVAAYTVPTAYIASLVAAALIFAVVTLPCAMAWTGFGVTLRQLLADPGRVRIFNVTMSVLLVASLWPLAADLLKPLVLG